MGSSRSPTAVPPRPGPARANIAAAALAISVAAAALFVATAGDYGLTIDEPVYIASADRVAGWFHDLTSDGRAGFAAALCPERLSQAWVFGRPENRNLPVPVLLASLGHSLSHGWLPPLVSYRVGTCLFFAFTLGVLFAALATAHGWLVACVATGSLLVMPRVFVHGHLNATDAPVSCFWLLTLLGWLRSGSSWRAAVLTALACGLGLATKATFVLVPLILGAWVLVGRYWQWWRAALVVAGLAPLVMLASCPMWWHAPLAMPLDYFRTVFRSDEVWRIEVYYLGRTYIGGINPLPWHNGWVLLAVTTPPWTLALAVWGGWQGLRRRAAETALWVIGAAALPALRMLPGTPGHDGIRLMLPSVFCLAPLAGFGCCAIAERVCRGSGARGVWLRGGLAALPLACGVASLAAIHPFGLSYYSELIGGLWGAERLGFEVSYWFDGLTPRALEQINERVPVAARVWIFPRYEGYEQLRAWGLWRRDLCEGDIGNADYLLLYARKSRFYAIPGIADVYERRRPDWSLRAQGVQVVGLYKL